MEPSSMNIVTDPFTEKSLAGSVKLLSESWTFFKRYWREIIPIVAFPLVLSMLGQFAMTMTDQISVWIAVLLTVAGLVFGLASYPATIDAISKLSGQTETNIDVKKQYTLGFSLFWSLVLLYIMQLFVTLGGLFMLIVPGIILSVYMTFSVYALVIEGKKGFEAIVRSYELIKGRWLNVLGRMIVLGVVALLAIMVVTIVGLILNSAFGFQPKAEDASLLQLLFSLVANVAVTGFSLVYMYRLYDSLKSSIVVGQNSQTFKKYSVISLVIGVIGSLVLIISVSSFLVFVYSQFVKDGKFDSQLKEYYLPKEFDSNGPDNIR